ncbi:MAG: DsbA family protein [Geminicoccaceae bacterium]
MIGAIPRPLGLTTLALALTLPLQPARAADELPQAEVERIVRDYLLREPEVIMQAIEELQRRRDLAASQQQREQIVANQPKLVADPRDPAIGNPDGDVTLVEFFDYRCGYCRAMVDSMNALIDSDPDLRVVMKEFPILGPDSLLAAKAALAADRQGAYAAMHFGLMAEDRIDDAAIRRLAAANGLDVGRLLADMESEPVRAHIQDNIRLAQSLGISGTPSFVIGEALLPGAVPLTALNEHIGAERSAAGG